MFEWLWLPVCKNYRRSSDQMRIWQDWPLFKLLQHTSNGPVFLTVLDPKCRTIGWTTSPVLHGFTSWNWGFPTLPITFELFHFEAYPRLVFSICVAGLPQFFRNISYRSDPVCLARRCLFTIHGLNRTTNTVDPSKHARHWFLIFSSNLFYSCWFNPCLFHLFCTTK